MAVDLIDPNEAINKFAFANGVPEYEKMQIFAELTAQRRGRSIIMSNGSGIFDVQKTIDSDLTVNMLGPDRDTNTFTTDWTKPSTGVNGVFEGFGITKINVKTNSSFVPVVSIDFVDIRGLSLFNVGKDSPYAVLHDFPPPMFNLTLKGYYGKSLTYQLHLVKQNTSFDAETGNYNTTAEFIARTFAPLTDVLFKYAELFPLMRKDTAKIPSKQANASPSGNQEPLNRAIQPNGTHNLLVNIETLYIKLAKILKNSPEKKELEEKQQIKEDVGDLLKGIGNFSSRFENDENQYYNENNTAMLHVNENSSNDNILLIDKFEDGINIITNINEYWGALKSDGDTGINEKNKLFLGIKLNTQNVDPNDISSTYDGFNLDSAQNIKARTTINNYRKTLISSYPIKLIKELFDEKKINETAINNIIPFIKNDSLKYILEYQSDNTYNKHYYVVIDITRFYQKIYRYYTNELLLQIEKLEVILGDKINNFATDELDMSPTIRNIFKIMCNDVDVFFNEMRKTAVSAQIHHNEPANYSKINNKRKDLPDQKNVEKTKIDAFPLYIEQTVQSDLTRNDKKSNCKRITRKQKAYPGKEKGVGLSTTTPFPEVELVENFMQVFIDIRNNALIRNIRNKENMDGTLIYIPITPYDSKLGNDNAYQSPYISTSDIDSVGISDQSFDRILYNLLNRFYLFSQYTYAESFYKSENKDFQKAIINFGGQSEASNVVLSISNKNNANLILKQLQTFINNVDSFYEYLNTNKITNYNDTNINTILLGTQKQKFEPIHKDKRGEYFGLKILEEPITERGGTTDDPVGKLITEVNKKDNPIFGDFFDFLPDILGDNENVFGFSKENVRMIKDINNGIDGETLYIYNDKSSIKTTNANIIKKLISLFSGSKAFDEEIKNDKILLEFLEGDADVESKYFLIISLFTFSKTILTNFDNENSIDIAGAINFPLIFLLYSGGILKYNDNYKSDLDDLFTKFKNVYYDKKNNKYFVGKYKTIGGNTASFTFINGGNYSVDDVKLKEDLAFAQFLSTGDTETLIKYYDDWITNGNGDTLLDEFISILKDGVDLNNVLAKIKYYTEQLENNDNIKTLYSTRTLVNYSELTLTKKTVTEEDIGTDPNRFVSLSETNKLNINIKNINDDFFNAFIQKTIEDLKPRIEFLNNEETELLSALEDTDIKTQTYYSFKNISDKWISGFGNDQKGFPFNKTPYDLETKTGGLIDQFIFVDRAFNDIGDKVIINLKPLLEYANDYDSSVFSVFSRILALNGFEFFPLQNFMSYQNTDWKDSFKIFETQEEEANPAFVCMYVGGVSSKLNTVVSDDIFENDGIGSFDERDEIPDFYQNENFDCDENDNKPSTTNNIQEKQDKDRNINIDSNNIAYNQVKAFRVRFGEQDQAIFKNIHLDTREFKDTNESLAILSEIAQDHSHATPIPKGQNLFNTFEQRSYSCTVDMMGDMMIQPTQYFQLENIPLFSGAYLILNVEHEFTANHATTSFMGVRILKYPVPYVIDFASSAGLKSSATTDESNKSDTLNNGDTSTDPDVVAYVEMNDLKINIT